MALGKTVRDALNAHVHVKHYHVIIAKYDNLLAEGHVARLAQSDRASDSYKLGYLKAASSTLAVGYGFFYHALGSIRRFRMIMHG